MAVLTRCSVFKDQGENYEIAFSQMTDKLQFFFISNRPISRGDKE